MILIIVMILINDHGDGLEYLDWDVGVLLQNLDYLKLLLISSKCCPNHLVEKYLLRKHLIHCKLNWGSRFNHTDRLRVHPDHCSLTMNIVTKFMSSLFLSSLSQHDHVSHLCHNHLCPQTPDITNHHHQRQHHFHPNSRSSFR